jgi:signal transduction histidine kinase
MISNSLKSRYVLSATLLVALIVVMLGWGTYSVRNSSQDSLDIVNSRRLAQLASSQIRDGVWETDFYLNAFLLTPSADNKDKLFSGLKELANHIESLADDPWTRTDQRRRLLGHLKLKIKTMQQDMTTLVDIRENREKRFPSLSIIRNQLYPANLEFVTLTSLALEEMPMAQMSAGNAEFYRLLTDTQRIWQRMIASFRLFVAYRSESISNPIPGMSNELDDIDTLYAGITGNLAQLAELKKTANIEIQASDMIDEMSYIAENWYENFKRVSEIHTSREWRRDDAIIKEQLQPLSQEIRRLLYQLDDEIDQSIKLEVKSLTHLAETIIERIWFLGIIILSFIVMGYYYLRNRVLTPISTVANGLLIQSQNNQAMQIPNTSTRELNQLVDAFNQLSDSLAKAEAVVRHTDKMATVGELASCVAHEINNPLNNMARITEFIEEEINTGNVSETVNKDFSILHREMDRCAGIVRNLLDFGKPREPAISRTSLPELLDESIQLLKHKALDNRIIIDTQIVPELSPVYADPSQIHQVFVNLLLNAIEFSPPGETITVALEQQDEQFVICRVMDHGPGADESKIEHFFDPFYTTRKGHEGMGLGLSVCYGIIQHHQGDIGAHAGEHDGLVVWFTLPVASA